MTEKRQLTDDLETYNAERNAVLISGDVNKLMEFGEKHLIHKFSCKEVAEIALHKMRTAIVALPMDLRRKSYKWLIERNMKTWDDGDLA